VPGECADPPLASRGGQSDEDLRPDTASLPVVDDGDGDLRDLGIARRPDEAADGHALLAPALPLGDRAEREVIDPVHLGEVGELLVPELSTDREEPAKARLGGQAVEAPPEQLLVPWRHRTQGDMAAVAERDALTVSLAEAHRPPVARA
jgi:hypothetical protein